MGSQLGKRYKCAACGAEVLCVKAGAGDVACDGKNMDIQEPKTVASSD